MWRVFHPSGVSGGLAQNSSLATHAAELHNVKYVNFMTAHISIG